MVLRDWDPTIEVGFVKSTILSLRMRVGGWGNRFVNFGFDFSLIFVPLESLSQKSD